MKACHAGSSERQREDPWRGDALRGQVVEGALTETLPDV